MLVDTSIDSNTPVEVFVDPIRLRQILQNLINNAMKFTDSGGEVNLSVVCLPNKDVNVKGGHVDTLNLQFCVTDTGIGIAPDIQSTLFLPFIQGDASTTRKYGGTGLGLQISRCLCELMGGSIRLISEVGPGATFVFALKVVDVAAAVSVRKVDTDVDHPPNKVTNDH